MAGTGPVNTTRPGASRPFGALTFALSCTLAILGPWSLSSQNAGAADTSSPGLNVGTPQLVYDGDFPDPSLLAVDGTFYAYSTNSAAANMPVIVSNDVFHWRSLGDGMAFLPSWAVRTSGFTWAPSVVATPGGGYEAFFSTLDTNGEECLGRATAPAPSGPFLDTSAGPLVCSDEQGAIDPSLFRTPTGDYLIWKADTGSHKAGEILAQELNPSDSALIGAPVLLLKADQAWEGGIVEGPSLAEVGGHFFLYFSANRWDTDDYAIGMTSCASPLGPCDQSGADIVLASGPGMIGPGGPDVFSTATHSYLAFSAWTGGAPGVRGSRRALFVAALTAGGSSAPAANTVAARVPLR
jgi:Glycosyl hydrolases family 43